MSNTWDESNLPDLAGHIVVVTGSSAGIGFENARAVALGGAQVVMAVRNVSKGEEKAAEIRKLDTSVQIDVREVDVGNLDSVRKFVADFPYSHINVLINNAGIHCPKEEKTAAGLNATIATNHYGPYLLTAQLMPFLSKVPGSRVVYVTSKYHENAKIDVTDIAWEKRKYDQWACYADSKRLNLYMMQEFNRRISDAGLAAPTFVAAHPGVTGTATMSDGFNPFMAMTVNAIAQTPQMGSLPTLRAAFDEAAQSDDLYGPDSWFGLKGHPAKADAGEGLKHKNDAKLVFKEAEARTAFKLKFD